MTARLLGLVDAMLGRVITGRSATAEFGLTPGARYQRELDRYSDADLIRRSRSEILAEIRATRRRKVGTR